MKHLHELTPSDKTEMLAELDGWYQQNEMWKHATKCTGQLQPPLAVQLPE
jgi:hypothetical protein